MYHVTVDDVRSVEMVRVMWGLVDRLSWEPHSMWRAHALGDVSEFGAGPDAALLRRIASTLDAVLGVGYEEPAGGSVPPVSFVEAATKVGGQVEYF